jgi:hypothetical protein
VSADAVTGIATLCAGAYYGEVLGAVNEGANT